MLSPRRSAGSPQGRQLDLPGTTHVLLRLQGGDGLTQRPNVGELPANWTMRQPQNFIPRLCSRILIGGVMHLPL